MCATAYISRQCDTTHSKLLTSTVSEKILRISDSVSRFSSLVFIMSIIPPPLHILAM